MFGEYASESVVAGESARWADLWRLCIDSPYSRGGGIDAGGKDACAPMRVASTLPNAKLSKVASVDDGKSNCASIWLPVNGDEVGNMFTSWVK